MESLIFWESEPKWAYIKKLEQLGDEDSNT
jgi:hypothetical protein